MSGAPPESTAAPEASTTAIPPFWDCRVRPPEVEIPKVSVRRAGFAGAVAFETTSTSEKPADGAVTTRFTPGSTPGVACCAERHG